MTKLEQAIAANGAFRSQGKVQGRTGRDISLAALSTSNNLEVIAALLTELRPKRTLEIGFCFAGSGLLMTAFHADTGSPEKHRHVAIDPFQSTVWDGVGEMRIEEAGLTPWFNCLHEFSHLALPNLLGKGERFDLIYVDGSHLFEDVFIDMFYCTRLLTDGGVILFDDASDPHISKVLKFVRRNLPALEDFDVSQYRSDGGGLRYRLAKLLGRSQMVGYRRLSDPTREWNAAFKNF